MSQGLDELTEQIARLSPEELRQLLRRLRKMTSLSDEDLDWMRAAEKSFAFWDNPDDAAYDER